MSDTTITVDQSPDMVRVTFVPPDERKPPTMDEAFFDRIDEILDEMHSPIHDGSCRALVFQSASPKTFLAGANIAVLETLTQESIVQWIERGHATLNRVESLPIPVIAVVAGYALGGGLEFALACDLIYATDNAKVGQTEARLGFVTGWGGSRRLIQRTGPSKAKELLFTGTIIGAKEAGEIGILDFVGTDREVKERVMTLIDASAQCSRFAVAQMKHLVGMKARDNRSCLDLELAASVRVMREGDTTRRIMDFLAKRTRGRD